MFLFYPPSTKLGFLFVEVCLLKSDFNKSGSSSQAVQQVVLPRIKLKDLEAGGGAGRGGVGRRGRRILIRPDLSRSDAEHLLLGCPR